MKFISEMGPDDSELMRKHVFGHDYKKDARGRPLEQGRGSDASFANPKCDDSTEAHCLAIEKNKGADAAEKERARIRAIQAKAGRDLHEAETL